MAFNDVRSSTVHEMLIEDHRADGCRSGEGSVTALDDGSLYMVYGRFEGPSDESHATLLARRSNDGGVRWSGPSVFRTIPEGSLNLMSVSLLRLGDGRLVALYLHKRSTEDCRPVQSTSSDGGRTWSDPRFLIEEPGYYVINNDRLVQLSGGRLLAPYWLATGAPGYGICGCLFSDDLGASWRIGDAIRIEKDHILQPKAIDASNAAAVRVFTEGDVNAQEPGVVELRDGRVLMWARSTGGYAYRALSSDGGETWSPFEAIPEFAMPCGPQSIKRLPDSDRLIMLFNDRGTIPYGAPQFQWRRPLSVAVSDDDAATWQSHGLLEPDTVPSNCYYSICFHGDNVVFTYYEGVMRVQRDGQFVPRNLASLKLKVVRQDFFR